MEKQICSVCVMDTSAEDIIFDEQGRCNYCKEAEKILSDIANRRSEEALHNVAEKIRGEGTNKKYDCVIGISGGVDSSYVAYLVKQLGLRPLAVHLDNGWNSELAVHNIRKLLEKLNIDLYTHVMDWQEFRDLQVAFLKASTPDSEIPTDHAIFALLRIIADKYHIKYIIDGCNTSSESILPAKWSYGHRDWKYIKEIHRLFGNYKLRTFPHFSMLDDFYFIKIAKIQFVSILEFIDYDKERAKQLLQEQFEWRDYGGKHYESIYTKIYQGYLLPQKFGYDKRKAHLSSLIAAKQITREEAETQLKEEAYNALELQKDIKYLCEKLQITQEEFDKIMNAPKKSFWDYASNETSFGYKVFKFAGAVR